MCNYAAKDLEIQHSRVMGATKDQITAESDELHKWLTEHADEGVFLVKDQRISPERMQKRYGNTAATKKAVDLVPSSALAYARGCSHGPPSRNIK